MISHMSPQPGPSPAVLRLGFAAGIPEVSRFSCMKLLGVSGVFDYAGLSRNSRNRSCSCGLPRITKTSASGLHLFESSIAHPAYTPVCLRFADALAGISARLGAERIAGPFSKGSYILCFIPVYPGAFCNHDERPFPSSPDFSHPDPEQLVQRSESTARPFGVPSNQLMAEGQVFEERVLTGAERSKSSRGDGGPLQSMTGILPKTANRVCRQISDSAPTSRF